MRNAADDTSQIVFQNALHIFGITVLFWDHILMLDTEIQLLWKRKKFASAYWFFVVRYVSLGINIPGLVFLYINLSENLPSLEYHLRVRNHRDPIYYMHYHDTARLCALWRQQADPLGVDRDRRSLDGDCSGSTCHNAHSSARMPSRPFKDKAPDSAGLWIALFVFDSMIFGLIVYNGWSLCRRRGISMPLHTLIIRDGAAYFGVVMLSNLANIATFFNNSPILPGALATFANCVSITMMARIMLNLHEYAEQGVCTRDGSSSNQSVPHFRSSPPAAHA
ncbi:hypothetical protein B0H15DRAFT_442722 [Mycena belliarum]|uniref:DUF6533 domain-containing protein n=1 Tax=Mycena belliarum TaxID=1033014 RepID=A0AAD6XKZ9_9AGAR|nr:hypothetical protein B0H15DRAFT_442722 [Mycena belliae]